MEGDEVDDDGGGGADSGGPGMSCNASETTALAVAGSQPSNAAASAADRQAADLAAARRLLLAHATRTGDDAMCRRLRKQMCTEERHARDAGTEVGMLLRKQMAAEREEDMKRRRLAIEEERKATIDLEDRKKATALAEEAALKVRLAALEQTMLNRQDADARRQAAIREREHQRWLQQTFPVELAKRCIAYFAGLRSKGKKAFQSDVSELLHDGVFNRHVVVPDLWEPFTGPNASPEWAVVAPFLGGPRRQVRCGLPFQDLLQEHVPEDRLNTDANETLARLFKLIVPRARDIFASLTWLRLLHVNQYSMEKSFVYGIVALSKWLGQDKFPPGIYDVWPPTPTSTTCAQGSQPSGSGAGREA